MSDTLTVDMVADRGDGRTRRVIRRCGLCATSIEMFVTPDDLAAYLAGEGYIQNLFPYLTAAELEMLVDGYCESCFGTFCPPGEDD